MNFKNLITIILVIAVLGVGFFYFSKQNQTKNSYNQSANTISLPLDPKHKGVSRATIIYTFTGKVAKVEPVGENTRLTLDISDSLTPEFLVKKGSNVFTTEISSPQAPVPVTITPSSIKTGDTVTIGMNYSLSDRTWSLMAVSIFPSKK